MTLITIITSGFSEVHQIGYDIDKKNIEFFEKVNLDRKIERGYGCGIDFKNHIIAFSYGVGNAGVLLYKYKIEDNKLVLGDFIGEPSYRMHNIHQIEFNDGLLYVTNDIHAKNRIDVYDPNTMERIREYFIPDNHEIIMSYGADNGFNTLYIDDEIVYVGAHNDTHHMDNPSILVKFNKDTGDIVDWDERGSQIHGYMSIPDGKTIWNNSNRFQICIDDEIAYELPTDQYSRGIALYKDYVFVSTSEIAKREDRPDTQSKIFVFRLNDDKLELYDVMTGFPQIHDIRIINVGENE